MQNQVHLHSDFENIDLNISFEMVRSFLFLYILHAHVITLPILLAHGRKLDVHFKKDMKNMKENLVFPVIL